MSTTRTKTNRTSTRSGTASTTVADFTIGMFVITVAASYALAGYLGFFLTAVVVLGTSLPTLLLGVRLLQRRSERQGRTQTWTIR